MKNILYILLAVITYTHISGNANAQVISTDKVDYMPGQVVIASGEGWEPYEVIDLSLNRDPSIHREVDSAFTCDASGKFSNSLYNVTDQDLGAFFLLTVTGRISGHTATITFNDAAGDYSIDFSAYNPEFYDRISYQAGMSLPVGSVSSPLGGTDHDKTVESLNPQNLGLGQIVAYEYFVRADAGGSCFNDQITIGGEFLTETTNGGAFGFDGSLGVVAAFVDSSPVEAFSVDGGTPASVSSFSWNLAGNTIESAVNVTGLDPGDEITVEVWVVLQQSIEAGIGGNVKTRLGAAELSGTCETQKTTINTGNQEIPLLQVGDFYNSDVNVSITKTDQSDQVVIGDDIIYTLTAYNAGPSVANIVDITDILDPNTSYVQGSWSTNDITGSGWTFATDGNTLTFSSQYLNIGESAEITLTAKVNNDINTPTAGNGGDACSGAEDVCNNVNVTTISNENDVSDNSDSQATGIICQDIGVTTGTVSNLTLGETLASISFTSPVGSPDLYTIDFDAAAEAAGFSDITDAVLNASPISINVPGTAGAGTYNATLKVSGSVNGCESTPDAFSITIEQAPPSGGLLFESCGGGSLINTLTDSWNGAWIDYDNDGWEDLYVTNKDGQEANKLYRNNGDGTFIEISSPPLTTIMAYTTTSTWADINNDGYLDVFVVNATEDVSSLYINNGGGNFTEAPNSGIYEHPDYFHGASWADYDNDGFVDLLVTNFFETRFHHLYHNNGDETFTRVYNTPITLESHRSMAPVWADYNNDGLVDVFIPNGNDEPNSLFKNLGNGQFSKVTSGAIAADAFNSVGAAWGDYNNDGWMDLFVANASGQQNSLYKNNGNGTFTKVGSSVVLDDFGNSHGVSWADVDNDGDLDLYVTNDVGAKYLYINDGAGNFSVNSDEPLTADFGTSFGHAWADYNRDGFLDVMVFTHDNETNQLFCNQGNENHWINIKLQGTNSNYSAIGAQIRVKVNGEWQVRQVSAQSGFGSQNSLRQHFGLGDAATIDSIEVTWPSGYVQYLTDITADQFITIVENDASLVKGVAYNDANGNCIKDPEEDVIANSTFNIAPVGTTVVTDAKGEYEVRLPEGSYDFQLNNANDYWEKTCSSTLAVGSNINTEYTLDIGIQPKVEDYDLYVSFGTTAWRRGFTSQSEIQFGNAGTSDVYNITLTVTYPEEILIQSASTDWSSESNNTYTWTFDTLKAGSEFYIQMTDSVTLNSTVGQFLPVNVEISANGTDLDLSNNLDAESIEVVGAIDPNDMLVTPKGAGSEGYIDKDQVLTYTIRFQNVGTYLASRAVIVNQIPEYLDFSTFEVLNSSHSYHYMMDNKGKLTVTYNNINLVDSTTNEPESHGFFKYSIRPKNTLMGGEKINNSSLITFDYEDPLRTNTLINTIRFEGLNEPLKLGVYPNPASDQIKLVILKESIRFRNTSEIEWISIYSMDGGLLLKEEGGGQTSDYLDISALRQGLYVVRVVDTERNVVSAKLKVQ